MSIKAMNWVWTLEELSAQETLVLLALADQANDQGYCYPSRNTIASKSRCSVRTVGRALKTFEELGLLRIEKRNTLSGRVSSEYFLNIDTRPTENSDEDFSLKNNPEDNLSLGLNEEICEPVDNPSFPYGNNPKDNLSSGVAQRTPEVTPKDTSVPWVHIKNLYEPNLSFPNGLGAREEVLDEERKGLSVSLSPVGEDTAPPGVSETPPTDNLPIDAGGVPDKPVKSSPNGSSVVSDSTGVSGEAVLDESPRFHTNSKGSSPQNVDWDLLARVLPDWMFKALNDDVARQATSLIQSALGQSWTVMDLCAAFGSNPQPRSMSSPAGLVLSRVKRVCAQPAPTLLKPSESLTGASEGGFRDVDEELRRLKSWMASIGWSLQNPDLPYPQRSVSSVDEVLRDAKDAELPDAQTRKILVNRLLTIRSLLAREAGGAL